MNFLNKQIRLLNRNVIFEENPLYTRLFFNRNVVSGPIQYSFYSTKNKLNNNHNRQSQAIIVQDEEFFNDAEKFDVPVLEFILMKGKLMNKSHVEIPEKQTHNKPMKSSKEKTRDSSLID